MAYGDFWAENPLMAGNNVALCCSASGQHVFVAQSNGYLYYSADYGVTWAQRFLAGTKDWRKIKCSGDASTLWAQIGAAQSLINSTDLGLTWSAPVRTTIPQAQGLYVTPDGLGIAQCGAGAAGDAYAELHVSNDGGTNWTSYRPSWGNIGGYSYAVGMSDDRQTIAMATGSIIRFSTNNGSTWSSKAVTGTNGMTCHVSADGTRIIGNCGTSQLNRTIDSGATWTLQGNSLAYSLMSATATQENILVVAGGTSLWASTDYGTNWTQPLPQLSVTYTDLCQSSDGVYAYCCTSTKFYRNQGMPLTLTSVTPNSGSTAGGNTLTLRGTGFVVDTTVEIGGTSVAQTLVSATEMTIVAPAHAAGAVDIVLVNP